jgi:hypothetical protein
MGIRRGVLTAALGALLVLIIPASASAAAPILKRVKSTQRHPSATWTLPTGVTAEVIEIASKPDTGYDGYFVTESAIVFALLRPRQTSWRDRRQLAPGTYYVHVKGADFTGCGTVPEGVCDSFWSNVLQLRIPKRPAYGDGVTPNSHVRQAVLDVVPPARLYWFASHTFPVVPVAPGSGLAPE